MLIFLNRKNKNMEIGPIYFDISGVEAFFSNNSTGTIVSLAMATFGWVILAYVLLYLGIFFLKFYKEEKLKKTWSWVLLAIDVPQLNTQTPKAVEQMFSHLAGAYTSSNLAYKFRHGFKQKWFSLEIVSIEGYIQFLIRTEVAFRDLVEAAVYAQYPQAEIIEVEDYTKDLPDRFPNETYDMWGCDFGLAESFAYPIRTYMEFEHSSAEENILKDPMGTFLESFSRIEHGEQMWFQILIEPTDNSWKEKVIGKIKDLVGEVVSLSGSKKSSGMSGFTEGPKKFLSEVSTQVFGGSAAGADVKVVKKETGGSRLNQLTPGQRKLLEAMENKITKIGFKTKLRAVYIARKEVFKPGRSINALFGAINQFNIPSANSIVPKSTVSTNYFWKGSRGEKRQTLMMSAYKKRKMKSGGTPFIFNIEELATIWHFPMSSVKTPLLQKTEFKKAEPPSGLPTESLFKPLKQAPKTSGGERKGRDSRKMVTDAGDVGYSDSSEKYG